MNKVAVYGTLRKGCVRNHALEGQTFLGEGDLPRKYWMYNMGAFPCVSKQLDPAPNPVKCEVYEVDDKTLQVLDQIEGHPSFYRRMEVPVYKRDRIDNGELKPIKSTFGICWVYVLQDHGLNEVIETGDWCAP